MVLTIKNNQKKSCLTSHFLPERVLYFFEHNQNVPCVKEPDYKKRNERDPLFFFNSYRYIFFMRTILIFNLLWLSHPLKTEWRVELTKNGNICL